MKLNCTL